MKEKRLDNTFPLLQSENGAVLVVSMLMLVVLTVIGIAASNTSILETLISNSHKKRQAAFYAAEAGIEHAKLSLGGLLSANANSTNAGEGTIVPWDFIFDDTTTYPTVSDSSEFRNTDAKRESFLFQNESIGEYSYTVTMGDNTDAAAGDTDGVLWVRSTGVGPRGERAILEVSYQGQFVETDSGESISDYGGQSKKGGIKASSGQDTEGIDAGNLSGSLHDQSV